MDIATWKNEVFMPWMKSVEARSEAQKKQVQSLKLYKGRIIEVIGLLLDGKNELAVKLWNAITDLPTLETAEYMTSQKLFKLKFVNGQVQSIAQEQLFKELNNL